MRLASRSVTIAALALVVGLPTLAWAHAHLVRSEPAENARVAVAPKAIQLWFSEPVDLAATGIVLKDSSGIVTPTGKAERGRGARGVRIGILAALHPGRYTVSWKNKALNGHPESGVFAFRLLGPAR